MSRRQQRTMPGPALWQGAPRRIFPPPGGSLTTRDISGEWRPSGSVAGAGVFAVVWSTRYGERWAALHDFAPSDALRLIDECCWRDQQAGLPGAWPNGRWD